MTVKKYTLLLIEDVLNYNCVLYYMRLSIIQYGSLKFLKNAFIWPIHICNLKILFDLSKFYLDKKRFIFVWINLISGIFISILIKLSIIIITTLSPYNFCYYIPSQFIIINILFHPYCSQRIIIFKSRFMRNKNNYYNGVLNIELKNYVLNIFTSNTN